MTIKRQFTLLAALLIIIPISCAGFTVIHRYVTSSKRMLMIGFDKSEKEYSKNYTREEWKKIKNEFQELPPDVEGILLYTEPDSQYMTVVLSTFKDYETGRQLKNYDLWLLIQSTSEKYYYQFSSQPQLDNNISLYLTRITKHQHENEDKKRGPTVVYGLIILLFVLIIPIFVMIIIISRNIFTSISILEKKTQEIADGNLNTTIDLSDTNTKPNEIISIANSLEKMRQSLLEAQNRKIKLIMGVSHDLRTPVAVIKGYTEGLKDGIITSPEEVKSSLELIETKTEQLEGMIDSLINYTKMNTAEIRQSLMPSDISKLIKEFVSDSVNSAAVFNRKIETDIKIDKEIIIPMDVQLVTRALENIFSNALRYTRENDKISIISYVEEKHIILKISDTGIGISEKDLEHIFDLFYRGTKSRQEEGMGIGLSVVQNVMNIHGWTIKCDSKINEGSTFTIQIPF